MKISACLVHIASVTFPLLACNAVLFAQQSGEPDASAMDDRFAIPRAEAQQVKVLMDSAPIPLQSAPLYTYDEKVRNWNQGTTWIWVTDGRPSIALNLSTFGRRRYFEFLSFADKHTTVTTSQGSVWTPDIRWNPTVIPGAPAPGRSRNLKLIQMRALARQFSAHQFESNGKSYNLRLLPQPIHRYGTESIDGAFFAFVRESDLEIIIVIETVKADDGGQYWGFECRPVAVNKQEVRHNDTVVWAHERNELNGNNLPYRLFMESVSE